MAQSQDGPVNVTFRALKRRGSVNPGDKIYMRISRTRPFRHLFVAYAESQDIPLALLSWSFDGIVVRGDQTPADLGLEVGGDVMLVAALRRASLRESLPRSPPPGGLLPENLRKLLEFLPLDEVHGAKRVSFCWRKAGVSAIEHWLWKPVKFVAEHGKRRSMLRETVPASELTDCREAWEVDPNETLRILFTWGSDPPLAARFLSIVEPSIDGLERIVRLCEPAHQFFYAKTQLYRWQYGPRYSWPHDSLDETVEVIMGWAELIGTPFDVPILDLLPVGRRDLVVSCVSRALQSWTDASVAIRDGRGRPEAPRLDEFQIAFLNGEPRGAERPLVQQDAPPVARLLVERPELAVVLRGVHEADHPHVRAALPRILRSHNVRWAMRLMCPMGERVLSAPC